MIFEFEALKALYDKASARTKGLIVSTTMLTACATTYFVSQALGISDTRAKVYTGLIGFGIFKEMVYTPIKHAIEDVHAQYHGHEDGSLLRQAS